MNDFNFMGMCLPYSTDDCGVIWFNVEDVVKTLAYRDVPELLNVLDVDDYEVDRDGYCALRESGLYTAALKGKSAEAEAVADNIFELLGREVGFKGLLSAGFFS